MSELPKPYIITIVGPESSGKTTLASQLSQILGCPWVPEYARTYLSGLGRPYEEGDLVMMARGQAALISDGLSEEIPAFSRDSLGKIKDQIFYNSSVPSERKSFLIFPRYDFGPAPRPILLVDSGILSIKLWAAIKYGRVDSDILKALENDTTDLYMLCRPVFTWEADVLREAPRVLDRVWIYNQYLKDLAIMTQQSNAGLP